MSTDKQIAANRLNALKSTGPRTEEGKARVSQNARKLGLFVADTVLPQEDPAEFAEILDAYIAEYKPRGPIEQDLVNDLALAMFKKRRYNRMETASLFWKGEGKTRIEATHEMRHLACRDDFKAIMRAQAQAQRDFLRTYKILEERKRASATQPKEVPPPIQVLPNLRNEPRNLQNKPNRPIEINRVSEPEGQAPASPRDLCINPCESA